MPLAIASAPSDDLHAAYLDYLRRTGRGNTAYTGAARVFFQRWPDPGQWAVQPLETRLSAGSSTRPIITFLMLHRVLQPGYDYLLERKLSSIWREVKDSPLGPDLDRFMTAAAELGFTERVRFATGSQVPVRLLIQTGRSLDLLTMADLDEFRAACQERETRTGKGHRHYLASVSNAQRVLFYLGIVDELPRSGGPVPFADRLADLRPPIRETMIAYLERKRATCQPKTVSAFATRLKHFGVFLAEVDPGLGSIAELDRRKHIEPYLRSLVDAVNPKNDQPITVADRSRRVLALMGFLTDITEWDWPDAPPRKLIFRDDVPKLPHTLPRYLPLDVDRRLTAVLTEHPGNELAAAALRLQRSCGLRIGELLDLELDCVHEVPDHGSWLKIPLGKLETERMIPIDDDILDLIDHITAIRSHGRPMPHPRYRRRAQFLFTHHGRRLSQSAVRHELDRAAQSAGLDHLTPHQLRHTYATALVNAGVSLQALMALLGHVSAEMSLRYGRLFDTTVRAEYERALDLAKQQARTPTTGTISLPLADITGGADWKNTPLLKSRLAGGFCLRAPAQGACAYANICEHCPSFHTEPSSLPILAAQRVDAEALARDAEQRGWIAEAQRHQRLIARLDILINEAQAG
ncbi:tyrosine-type recombinase/integrase [Saccharopolyspora phatthalungensis]|uniref:Integrase n=1 Tax=Saccharopolyspora phatthalungensis TaxID=664693 RepID=A0A840Q401_9PSEU|nr:tyrosine-type recombinase/integrase [Saccharopolyspora phatthalungensis]MBB5152853.1 integrase [Saccharopolyspora phatthalungensis]MBB5154351.1 integrase [Saccharopolyspora phatthalungensis]